jgi:hypothetical protein
MTQSPVANTLLTLEQSGSLYLSMLSTGDTGIMFGDAASNTVGRFLYEHSVDRFAWYTSGTFAMALTSAQYLGINTLVPDTRLHVFEGASSGTPHANAIATFEHSGNAALQILSGTSSIGAIYFGDSGGNLRGFLSYHHGDERLSIGANGSDVIYIDASLNTAIGGEHTGSDAILELVSTTKGFLPPVMTAAERDAISGPTDGMMIFNTTAGTMDVYSSGWQTLAFA